MVEAKRSFKNGKEQPTFQTRYYISSKDAGADYFTKNTIFHSPCF